MSASTQAAPVAISATAPQTALIAKLLGEGRTTSQEFDGTKWSASAYITALLAAPRTIATAPRATGPVEAGMYRKGEDIFRVKISQTGNPYAMRLVSTTGDRLRDSDELVVHWQFVYERGAIFQLSAADKLSLDEARAFGIRTGTCCVCAKVLTDAKSVLRGIGPVCAKVCK